MPLRAISADGKDVIAPLITDAEWETLRADKARGGLHMPGTKAPAIPKVSPNGLRFFAHKPGTKPAGASHGETMLHLEIKRQVILAARNAGWDATTEITGVTPNGEEWRADVLCRSGHRSVAIEAQVSAQRDVEYLERQARYKCSGIRGLWLEARPHSYRTRFHSLLPSTKATKDLPIFRLWSPAKSAALTPNDIYQVDIDGQHVMLQDFIIGCLRGDLKWIGESDDQCGEFWIKKHNCWRCRSYMLWTRRLNMGNYIYSIEEFWNNKEATDAYIRLRRKYPHVPPIEIRYSRSIERSRPTAVCVHCNSIQGDGMHDPFDVDLRVCVSLSGSLRGDLGWKWRYADGCFLEEDGVGKISTIII